MKVKGESTEAAAGARPRHRLSWLRPALVIAFGIALVVFAVPISGYNGKVVNGVDALNGLVAVAFRFGGWLGVLLGLADALTMFAVAVSARRNGVDSETRSRRQAEGGNSPSPRKSFQSRVADWLDKCFAPPLYTNMTERGDRLVEEVLELLQSKGYDPTRIPTLIEYVWNRPVGDPPQEVGGVMATLAAYCSVAGLDMEADGWAELERITRPDVMAKIRAKQEAKNKLRFGSPLPGNPAA